MVPFKRSLAIRVFFLSFILLTFPLLVDLIILINQRFTQSLYKAQTYLEQIGKVRELPMSELLPTKSPILSLVEHTLELNTKFPASPSEELNQKLRTLTEKGGLNQIDLYKIVDGKYIALATSYDKDVHTTDTFVGRDDTDFILALDLNPDGTQANTIYDATETRSYFVNAKVIHENGEPVGVLVIYTDISESLNTFLLPDTDRYPVFFAIMGADTLIYASTDPSLVFHYFIALHELEKKAAITELKIAEEGFPHRPLPVSNVNDYPYFEFTWKGKEYIAYALDIPFNDFFLLVFAEKNEVHSYLLTTFIRTYSTYFIILLLGGIIAFFITKRLARPISSLTTVMDEIQKGNNTVRYKPDRFGYELNLVGETFNEMMDTLLSKKKVAEEERVNFEIYNKELKLGEEVQKRLYLNKKIIFPGIDVTTRYIPAKEVGGDFCDIFIDNTNLVLMVADASGKGVEACFYSLLARGLLRIFSRELKDVAKVIKTTNKQFVKDVGDSGIFVTVLLAIYDPEHHRLSYYSAGHNPPILRKKNGDVSFLETRGVALGVEGFEDEEKNKKEVSLESGDLIFFYTDGITEAHDQNNELFGEQRLLNLVQAEGDKNVDGLSDLIVNELKKFSGKAPQHDDITLIAMKVL